MPSKKPAQPKRKTAEKKRHPNFFKEWREKLDLTQGEALDRLEGWNQSKLSRIETGATIWDAVDLADLEHAYGVSSYLLLNVDPTKEGEAIDLMALIKNKNREQAIRILKALDG